MDKSHTIKCVMPLSVNFVHLLMLKESMKNPHSLKMRYRTRKHGTETLMNKFDIKSSLSLKHLPWDEGKVTNPS